MSDADSHRRAPSSQRSSTSPVARRLHAISGKLTQYLSKDSDTKSIASTLVDSLEEERRPQSCGRGGFGNIRSTPQAVSPPQAFAFLPVLSTSPENPRGRDTTTKKISTGRGGAGNFRNPSTSPVVPTGILIPRETSSSSSGRGGLGNIVRPSKNDQTHPPHQI